MKKVIGLIIAILVITLLSYYNQFLFNSDKATPVSFTESEKLLIEEAASKEFTMADQYQSGVGEQIAELFKSIYDIDIRVLNYSNFDDVYADLNSNDIDFGFDIAYKSDVALDFNLEFSMPYITNINTIYYNQILSDYDFTDKIVYCRTIEMCELFKTFGITFKETVVESNMTVVHDALANVANAFYYDYNLAAPDMFAKGYAIEYLDETIDYLPLHFVTGNKENEKYLDLFKKIYTTKEFVRALETNMAETNNQAKLSYLSKFEAELDYTKTYKVFFNDLYPFAYHEDGSWKGAYVDVVLNFFKDMGLKYEVLNLHQELPEGEYLSKLFYDEIDVITPLGVVESRRDKVLFSDTQNDVSLVAIKRDTYSENYNSYSELYYEKVGIFNTGVDYELPRALMAGKEFKVYDSYESLFAALMSKEVNYVICTKKYYEQYQNANNEFSIVVDERLGTFGGVSVVIAFNNGDEGHVLREAFSFWSDEDAINRNIEQITGGITPISYFKQREYIINTLGLIMIALIASVAVVFFTLSRYDSLTKVKNRHAFTNDFRKVIPQGYTLFYIDLNKFKLINDTYGHSSGDMVLNAFANKSKKYKGLDMYRIGGDEFVVVTNLKKIGLTVQDIVDDFREVAVLNPETEIIFKVTASIGYMHVERPMPVNLALEYVDYAMYKAKTEENIVVHVDDEFIKEIDAERKVITRITQAFEKQKIQIKFNPVVNVHTKEVVTFMVDQYWNNGGKLEHIEERLDFIKQIGLIERLDSINLSLLIGAYNQLLHEDYYKDQTFTVSMTESTFERTVKTVIGENKAIDSFFANQLVIRVENDTKLSKVSSALLQEFSKRGVMIHLDDLKVRDDVIELINNVNHLYIMVDKTLLFESSEQYLLYNAMTEKINEFKAMGAELMVTGVDTRIDYAKVSQFDIDYVMGKYISEQLEPEDLKKFLAEEKFKDRLDVRQKLRK